jgi:large subunit GTPase 1
MLVLVADSNDAHNERSLAERTNVKVVSTPSIPNSKNPYLLSAQESRALTKKQDELKGSLRVPRRAAWDETTTRVELEKNERDSFLEWRRGLAE